MNYNEIISILMIVASFAMIIYWHYTNLKLKKENKQKRM